MFGVALELYEICPEPIVQVSKIGFDVRCERTGIQQFALLSRRHDNGNPRSRARVIQNRFTPTSAGQTILGQTILGQMTVVFLGPVSDSLRPLIGCTIGAS